jgi:hypothetical protein
MITARENNPIIISLTQMALTSGWSVDGTVASHDSCNSGNIYLLNYPLTTGQSYRYTYDVISRSSGYVQAFLGSNSGAEITTTGIVDETVVANGPQLYFYSNGTLSIDNFSIEVVSAQTNPFQQNTIAYCEKNDKWTSFYSYIPDSAFSLFVNTYSFYQGNVYLHEHGSPNRCNFYNVQYPATIYFSSNEQPTISKTFLSLNYQANQLLITPPGGIGTSLNQLSQLVPANFIQAQYNDGSVIYSTEGLYQASFLRNMNVDIINGDPLKGNWVTIGLMSTSPSMSLNLFSTEIRYAHSYQHIR